MLWCQRQMHQGSGFIITIICYLYMQHVTAGVAVKEHNTALRGAYRDEFFKKRKLLFQQFWPVLIQSMREYISKGLEHFLEMDADRFEVCLS